jgi:hypothetical protein
VDDAYRGAESAPTRAPLTIRWSNLAGSGWAKGTAWFVLFIGLAAMFFGTFAVMLHGLLRRFERDGHWSMGAFVLLPVLLGMGGFFVVGAIGTGGITLTKRNAVRYRGLLYIPLLRTRYRIEPEWMVRVQEQRVQRRNGSYMTYTAVIHSGGNAIPLRHFFQREHAEAQAQRVRDYLAG